MDELTLIDLRSDTVTRPTPEMRAAIAAAVVGDDVFGEDPTVNELEAHVAALFGRERALFVPTGTMANLVAILAQTRPGDAIILHEDAHSFEYESGNLAMVGGLMPRVARGDCGLLEPDAVRGRMVTNPDHHFAPTTLIAIENTTNRGGGAVYTVDAVRALHNLARETGHRLHCDGARIFNAIVATGARPSDYGDCVDTLSFCFSKGLGAPAGSIVVGDSEVIDRAHRFRKMLGGGLRQAGILAAAARYALDNHVDRLQMDHDHATLFRDGLDGTPGITFPMPSPTNIVYVGVDDARAWVAALEAHRVRVLSTAANRLRVVFHLDVSEQDTVDAMEAFRAVAVSRGR